MGELAGSLFGVGFVARAPDAVIDRIPLLVPFGAARATVQVERSVEAREGDLVALWPERGLLRWTDAESAALSLASEIELSCAACSPRFVLVHAGVVSVGSRALVLPGRSMAGKSTLTAALVDAGAQYLSDEYALLDDDGLVHPYARSIRLRDGGAGPRRLVQVPAAKTVSSPCRAGLVASLTFGPDWSVTEQTPGATVLAMLDNAVAASVATDRCVDGIVASLSDARGLFGHRGDAADAAGRLISLLKP